MTLDFSPQYANDSPWECLGVHFKMSAGLGSPSGSKSFTLRATSGHLKAGNSVSVERVTGDAAFRWGTDCCLICQGTLDWSQDKPDQAYPGHILGFWVPRPPPPLRNKRKGVNAKHRFLFRARALGTQAVWVIFVSVSITVQFPLCISQIRKCLKRNQKHSLPSGHCTHS